MTLKRFFLTASLFAALLAGCGGAALEEPAAVDAEPETGAETEEALPALAPVDPDEAPAESDNLTKPAPTPGPDEEMVVEPAATVNLSELTPPPTIESEPQEMPAPGVPDPYVALVSKLRSDLAGRLNVDVGEIAFGRMIEVNWPDSGLGCPQPGMSYLQVITPGLQVILEADGEQYFYHVAGNGENYVLCEDAEPVEPGGAGGLGDT